MLLCGVDRHFERRLERNAWRNVARSDLMCCPVILNVAQRTCCLTVYFGRRSERRVVETSDFECRSERRIV